MPGEIGFSSETQRRRLRRRNEQAMGSSSFCDPSIIGEANANAPPLPFGAANAVR